MATSRRNGRRAEVAAAAEVARASAAPRGAAADPWSTGLRHQLECGTLAFVAMLESAESMHRFLLESTQRARKRHEAIRARIHAAPGVERMAMLESELWQFDADLAARYWEEVGETLAHMNAELLDETGKAVEHWFEDAQGTAAALAEQSVPAGMEPFTRWLRTLSAANA